VGGKPTNGKFIRLTVEHIAVSFSKILNREEQIKKHLEFIGDILKERFEGRGWM
jgi:hypothetical protein